MYLSARLLHLKMEGGAGDGDAEGEVVEEQDDEEPALDDEGNPEVTRRAVRLGVQDGVVYRGDQPLSSKPSRLFNGRWRSLINQLRALVQDFGDCGYAIDGALTLTTPDGNVRRCLSSGVERDPDVQLASSALATTLLCATVKRRAASEGQKVLLRKIRTFTFPLLFFPFYLFYLFYFFLVKIIARGRLQTALLRR